MSKPLLSVHNLAKTFTLHLHGSKILPVLSGVNFEISAGECVVLGGPSGTGKSSILKMIYGNYAVAAGEIWLNHQGKLTDVAKATPAEIIALRKHAMGYVSQFLRVIPRISAQDIVAAAARNAGANEAGSIETARALLSHLHLPERLWNLPPATFSGGEQQRVNIARGFAGNHPLMILDEPTASLDAANSAAVVALIKQRKSKGTAFIGIFHDEDVRTKVADRIIDVGQFGNHDKAAAA